MVDPSEVPPLTTSSAPVARSERIHSLDAIRGVAALGILVMNAVSFGLPDAAYANLSAAGSDTPLDWAIGMFARVFVDQKMMALFSLLFGVGIVIFVERAAIKGRRSIWLNLWRNFLLLLIGIAHTMLWPGDVLTVYAICAPVVLLLRKLPAKVLIAVGTGVAVTGGVVAIIANASISPSGSELGWAWFTEGSTMSDGIAALLLLDGFGRALGLMLIGVGLYRLGVVQGRRSPDEYRRVVRWGFGVGAPLATAGLVIDLVDDWSPSTALLGHGVSTLGTVPIALAYLSLIVLWSQRTPTAAHHRVQAVGRMALTNYLSQTILGVIVLRTWLDAVDLSRTVILGFVLAVWTVQLLWSQWWLDRFRFGPVEWLWRTMTYRSRQPLRIDTAVRARRTAAR